jgi:hypothetical protein
MQAFESIKARIENKLSNYKVKFLSQAGKEILLKAIVQAISTYNMNVFLFPTAICKDMNRMMQDFLWEHMSNNSRIHWMS